MLRFSNGLLMNGGVGIDGKGFFQFQGENLSLVTNTGDWHLDETIVSSRMWWRDFPETFNTFKKPVSDAIYFKLITKLNGIFPVLSPHPVLINGALDEAKRIFPGISEESNALFKDFMHFLNYEFNLFETLNEPAVMGSFSDDLGPVMIGISGNDFVLPPEVPTLHSAPEIWGYLTWIINNHFAGPYPNTPEFDKLKGKRFEWGNLELSDSLKNEKIEGLVYFFIAKYILIYEAWANKANNPLSFAIAVNLIQKNEERPWQYLY